MRIIGEIPHPDFKITVFKMNNRLSVKFERGLMEQTYKFRESHELHNFHQMEKLVDQELLKDVHRQFVEMEQTKQAVVGRFYPHINKEFEDII